MTFSQEPHSTLLIPGPIEVDDVVLQSMSLPSESHVGPAFVEVFGDTLTKLRALFKSTDPKAQPIIISGSGTLGWDQVASNIIEPGRNALVIHSGYFADSFADCLEAYGVNATQLKAPIGSRPSVEDIESAILEYSYDIITITHVDTSTGVLSDVQAIAQKVRRVSPGTLIVVDGVCSVGCEDIEFDKWGLDVVLTASQKAIGVPPGLSIVMASARAIAKFEARKSASNSYYASWKNWLPIMRNYEARKPSYFATPPVQLVRALHASLEKILSEPLENRFKAHAATSDQVKAAIAALGLRQLAEDPANQAHGMTAVYWPEGVSAPDVLPALSRAGIVFAGGLHRDIASKYFRIGHMGVSATDPSRGDLTDAMAKLKTALAEAAYDGAIEK